MPDPRLDYQHVGNQSGGASQIPQGYSANQFSQTATSPGLLSAPARAVGQVASNLTRGVNSGSPPIGVEIPEWLRKMKTEGYGQNFVRAGIMQQGLPIAKEFNRTAANIAGLPSMRGFSGSGFVEQAQNNLETDKKDALAFLQAQFNNNNEQGKISALKQINDLNLMDTSLSNQWENAQQKAAIERQHIKLLQEQYDKQRRAQSGRVIGGLISGGLGLAGLATGNPAGAISFLNNIF